MVTINRKTSYNSGIFRKDCVTGYRQLTTLYDSGILRLDYGIIRGLPIGSSYRNGPKHLSEWPSGEGLHSHVVVNISSYDVADIQWITPCHKNRMACNNTLASRRNVIDNVRANNAFLAEIMSILEAIKFHYKGSHDEQNLTLMVILYEIYETRQRLIS